MDMYGVEGEREDTSNEAYFYRHFRAEAREKLFYEELFESRMKQQQILEEKEKRQKKKHKKRKKRKPKSAGKGSGASKRNGVDENTENAEDAGDDEESENDNDIDLSLPKIPKGPWTYKLGAKYDKKPTVPAIVSNLPQFNYDIPYKKLKNKQFIIGVDERSKLENWWKRPPHLIRRVDYGNMGNVTIPVDKNDSNKTRDAVKVSNAITKPSAPPNTSSSLATSTATEKDKVELIKLYKLISMKQKEKTNNSNQCEDKRKSKKKQKKNKHKAHKNGQITSGPVDVRSLLSQKQKRKK
eukprot:CAMPEP_0197029110 /NCGR_PEP_ID=MMETSP1384-20130603/8630_1 /TAXON_ID=29189 /ORGANISM="Ammonia sp." /LENGTH=296 /DNA_ID=CAMNT_0042458213 /DNA_START=93 /DNA_END=983 /DNA_ORIENTATION=-